MQPAGETLVNLETIFFTDPRPVRLTLTILGQAVTVEATPVRYHWDFGDGASTTTTTPGAPYPRHEVTHRYTDAGRTVRPAVSTTYSARFRVNGGGWQSIDQTVTMPGPPTELRVVEATPELSGER